MVRNRIFGKDWSVERADGLDIKSCCCLDKVLFSADGFGKFGALDVEEDWDCEARRYYIGIVGKYGPYTDV